MCNYVLIQYYFLYIVGAVFFPSTVTGCSISSAQIKAFYATGDGLWKIQLAWSSDNPDCKVHLEEEVDGKEKFQIVDTKECRLLYSIHTHLQTKTTEDLCTRHLEEQVDGQAEFQIAQSIMLASININPAIVYKVLVFSIT